MLLVSCGVGFPAASFAEKTDSGPSVSGSTAGDLGKRLELAQVPLPRARRVRPSSSAIGQDDSPALDDLGNKYRPREAALPTEPIWIDFEEVNLMTVIETIGAKTGRNFEVDPSIGSQKVTVISHHPVPPELAYEVLESILASRSLVMIETLDGNLVKIVPRGQNAEKLEIHREPGAPTTGFDNYSIHIVNVQYADASEIAQLLKTVGSSNSNIAVYPHTNTLIISDTADGLRNM